MKHKNLCFSPSSLVGVGVSITPILSSKFDSDSIDKMALVDWLSVTFDFIEVMKANHDYFFNEDSVEYLTLLKILNVTKKDITTMEFGLNGYSNGLLIGEHIKLFYGRIENRFGNQTMQLLMSGQALREFEYNLKGSIKELLNYLMGFGHTSVTRIDIAIDDFTGSEFDIYDIPNFLNQVYYVSPFVDWQFRQKMKKISETELIPKEFVLTFGSPGSNQLVIYDKLLERIAAKDYSILHEKWYRYEMRFVREKADAVVEKYLTSVNEKDSTSFMQFASETLYKQLDLKKKTYSKTGKKELLKLLRKWDTDTKWLKFLNVIKKIKLDVKMPPKSTIKSVMKYLMHSYSKTMTELKLALKGSDISLEEFILTLQENGFKSIDNKSHSKINYYRELVGLQKITKTDVNQEIENVKTQLNNMKYDSDDKYLEVAMDHIHNLRWKYLNLTLNYDDNQFIIGKDLYAVKVLSDTSKKSYLYHNFLFLTKTDCLNEGNIAWLFKKYFHKSLRTERSHLTD